MYNALKGIKQPNMNLEFIKVGDDYVAEFKVEGDFNLHIEKSKGELAIYQSSVEGAKYDYVKTGTTHYDKVVDLDFVGVIYPKYIKIECATLPTLAVVTSAGEVSNEGVINALNTEV